MKRPVICSAEAPISVRAAGAESANSRRVVVQCRSLGDRTIFDRHQPRHQSDLVLATNMTTLHWRFVSPTWTQLSRHRFLFLQHFVFEILFSPFGGEYVD